MLNRIPKIISQTASALLLGGVISAHCSLTYAASGPQLELFPVSVQESFKQAETHTTELQEKLLKITADMGQQTELYQQSKCDAISDDAGCRMLRKQMQDKFMELNSVVKSALPQVKRSVEHAHKSLKKSLQRMASRYTPAQLLDMNRQATRRSQHNQQNRSKTKRTSLGQVVAVFRGLNKGIGSKQTNLYVLASQAYQDLNSIVEELALLNENVNINEVMASIGISINDMDAETVQTMTNFRNIVMGEEDGFSELPDYPEADSTESINQRLTNYF